MYTTQPPHFTFTTNSLTTYQSVSLDAASAQSGRGTHHVVHLHQDTSCFRSSNELACTRGNAAVAEALRRRGLEGQSALPVQFIQRGGESAVSQVVGTVGQSDGGRGSCEREQVRAVAAEGSCGRAADHLVGAYHGSGSHHALKGVRIHDVGEWISLAHTANIVAGGVTGVA